MKLILKNNSSDDFIYANGTVVVSSESELEVNNRYWFSLYNDINLIKDIRLRNVVVNDGLKDYDIIEAELYIKNLAINESNKDSDGSSLSRVKVTTSGWHYQLHGVEFETAKLNSIYSKKADGTDYNFTTMKFFELIDGVETIITDENLTQEYIDAHCIRTDLDWEPTHDLEIIGGMLNMQSVPSADLRMWTIGVPDIPAPYGGSKPFAANVNLKFVGIEEGIKVDGRAPKYLSYNAIYHTTKLRMVFRHEAGFKHKLQMIFELFKE
jgi:hypothetical protein